MNTTAPPPSPRPQRSEKEIISGLQNTVSASRLSLFLSCSLKFYYRYVLELQKAKTPALHVGSALHETLKSWNKSRWLGKTMSLKEVHDKFSKAWSDNSEGTVEWDNKEEEDEQKGIGWKLVDAYLREFPFPPNQKPDAVEVSIDADLNQHGLPKLVGILDLVQEKQIVDFKTASSTPNSDKVPHTHEVQTTSYAVLYREATGSREQGIQLHHLVKTKSPKVIISHLPPMSEHQRTRLFHLIELYVRGLDRKDFRPAVGLQCHSCRFYNECRRWT